MKPEQHLVHNMLLDTIRLLCKNSLPFSESLRIEGVIGITTDNSDVFLVHVNETLATETSSAIVNRETSHEPSFGGIVAPVKRSRTVSTAPVSQQNFIKIEDDLAPTKRDDFSFGRVVTKSFKNNASGFEMPVLQKTRATRTTYESEGSTAISSTVVTQSFMLGTNNDLQNEGVYYEEADQDEYGEQVDYKSGEEQEMWGTVYDSQNHYANHHESFVTPSKLSRNTKTKQQSFRGSCRSGARVGKVGQGRASKSVDDVGERNPMSASDESNQYVITQSTHVCGYPDCMKKFSFKKNLLYHQTKVHGREPVRRSTPVKCSTEDYNSGMMEGDYSNDGPDKSSGWNPMSASGKSNQYVITQSTHACGYPDCTKKFSFKKNLLYHQTKVHGRKPRRRNTPMQSALSGEYGPGTMEADYSNDNEILDHSYGYEQYE